MPYQYALSLVERTIDCLATHPGKIQVRISTAHSIFWPLRAEHLPEELHADLRVIEAALAFTPRNAEDEDLVQRRGTVAVRCERMMPNTGVRIADAFLRIRTRLRELEGR